MRRGCARICAAVVCAAATIGATHPAWAQLARTPRPYRALFDPDPDPDSVQSLVLNGSAMGGWDTNVLAQGAARGFSFGRSSIVAGRGTFGAGSASLTYSRTTKPLGFFARARTSDYYFPKIGSWIGVYSGSLGADFSHALWSHATLQVTPTVMYANNDRLRVLDRPDDVADDAFLDQPDYGVIDRRALRYWLRTSLTQQLGPRTTVGITAFGRYTDRGSSGSGYRSLRGDGEWQYQIVRNAALYFRYGYQEAEYASGQSAVHQAQLMSGGIKYGRALSLTRKTSLQFRTGTAFVGSDSLDQAGGDTRRANLTGAAALVHEIGRSWYTEAAYDRDLRFYEDVAAPVMSDRVSVMLSGFLGPSTDFSAVAAYINGANARHRASHLFDAYTGSVQLRRALSRQLSVYSQYLYYHYEFREGVVLANIPSALGRHSARVGISASLPLLR